MQRESRKGRGTNQKSFIEKSQSVKLQVARCSPHGRWGVGRDLGECAVRMGLAGAVVGGAHTTLVFPKLGLCEFTLLQQQSAGCAVALTTPLKLASALTVSCV